MTGEFVKVRDALYSVTGRLRNNIFSSITSNGPGTRSTYAQGNGYHSNENTNLTQSMDSLKLSSSIDHPPAPGKWQSPVIFYSVFSYLLFPFLSLTRCPHLLSINYRWDMMLAWNQLLLKVVWSLAGLHRIPPLHIYICFLRKWNVIF